MSRSSWYMDVHRVVSEFVITYARSRTSQLLTDVPAVFAENVTETVEVMKLDKAFLDEPKNATQASNLDQTLANISELCSRSEPIVVQRRILGS